MTEKVWFITGTSRGFGRIWAQAALARGDRVAATARDVKTLAPLVERYPDRIEPIALDVTDRPAVFRAIEELSEADARAQIETNLFGALWVTQAALPIMRAQRSGHILQVSSIGGVSAFPTVGMYHASKWGLEGFSQSLAIEVAGFGIKVTLVEPGGYATEWSGVSATRSPEMPEYAGARTAIAAMRGRLKPGDPQATAAAILKVVDAAEPPLRIFFGTTGLPMARAEFANRLEIWDKWNDVSVAAQGN